MKKLLALLIIGAFATTAIAADKPKAPVKKEIKKHKKFEGSKVADDKPKKPVAKKK